ncbi:MAG: IS5/IS1182 family transposase, partial [Flavobacterium sp.]
VLLSLRDLYRQRKVWPTRQKQKTNDWNTDFNGFRRFSLKGLQKVELGFGLMALGHNLRKKIAA